MSLLDTLITLKAVEFDVMRRLFPPIEGTILYLLQPDGTVNNYQPTDARPAITAGWYVQTNKYQQTREIMIATSETNFWQVLLKSSHLAMGAMVFTIDKASALPPSEKYPYYTVAIESSGETYTP